MAKCLWPPCPNVADSDEDVLPNWARRHMGIKAADPGRHFEARNILVSGLPPPVQLQRIKAQNSAWLIAYQSVCQPCNYGWMKALQDGVSDILKPPIDGKYARFDSTQRRAIGSWAAMTAITIEWALGIEVAEERRSYLYEHTRSARSPYTPDLPGWHRFVRRAPALCAEQDRGSRPAARSQPITQAEPTMRGMRSLVRRAGPIPVEHRTVAPSH